MDLVSMIRIHIENKFKGCFTYPNPLGVFMDCGNLSVEVKFYEISRNLSLRVCYYNYKDFQYSVESKIILKTLKYTPDEILGIVDREIEKVTSMALATVL